MPPVGRGTPYSYIGHVKSVNKTLCLRSPDTYARKGLLADLFDTILPGMLGSATLSVESST